PSTPSSAKVRDKLRGLVLAHAVTITTARACPNTVSCLSVLGLRRARSFRWLYGCVSRASRSFEFFFGAIGLLFLYGIVFYFPEFSSSFLFRAYCTDSDARVPVATLRDSDMLTGVYAALLFVKNLPS